MSLVLITGITGFLAAHCLDAVLDDPAGYRVRGTLRSKGKAEELLARFSSEQRSRIELVEVKDTASSDLTQAIKDVDYILHTASPYQPSVEDVERDLLKPALDGTLNVLRYAHKEPSVKFVAITSSFAAIRNANKGGHLRPGFTYTEDDWNPSTVEEAKQQGGLFAYAVSKALAEKGAWDFVREQKPHYKIAAFNPPMIYGPTLQPSGKSKSSLNTSSKGIYALISGLDAMPEDKLPLFCHGRDVADAHVRAIAKLNEGAADRRWLLCGGTFTWGMAVKHIAKTHPELKDRLPKGWESAKEKDLGQFAKLDSRPAQQVLGIKFRDWKVTLDESIDSLLELEKGSQWEA